MIKNKILIGSLVIGVILVGGLILYTLQEKIPTEKSVFTIEKGEKETGAPSTPISVSLSTLADEPKLNEIIEITCAVSSILDAPDTSAEIILPEGVDLISGDVSWKGDLRANAPISFSAKIKLTEAKNLEIGAVARHIIDEENSWGDIDVLYFNYTPTEETEIKKEQESKIGKTFSGLEIGVGIENKFREAEDKFRSEIRSVRESTMMKEAATEAVATEEAKLESELKLIVQEELNKIKDKDGFVKLIDTSELISALRSHTEALGITKEISAVTIEEQSQYNYWRDYLKGYELWYPTFEDYVKANSHIERYYDRKGVDKIFVYVVNKDNPDASKIFEYCYMNWLFTKKGTETDYLLLTLDNSTTPNELRSWLGGLWLYGKLLDRPLVGGMLIGNDIPYKETYFVENKDPSERFQDFLPTYYMDFDEIPMFNSGEQVPLGLWFILDGSNIYLFIGHLSELEAPMGVVYGDLSEIKHYLLSKSFPTYSADGPLSIADYGYAWYADRLSKNEECILASKTMNYFSQRDGYCVRENPEKILKSTFTELTHKGGIYNHRVGHGMADGYKVSSPQDEAIMADEPLSIYSPNTLMLLQESCLTGSFAPHLPQNHKIKEHMYYFLRDRTMSKENSIITSMGATLPIMASGLWIVDYTLSKEPDVWFGNTFQTQSLIELLPSEPIMKSLWARVPGSLVIHGDPTISLTDFKETREDLIGDVNSDSNVNKTDVDLLLNYIGHPNGGYKINTVSADINGDGIIDVSDISILSRFVSFFISFCGDVNCDGKVDKDDAMLLMNYIGYPGKYTICSEWAADVTCDGKIDISDLMLLYYHVGFPGNPSYSLKCCEK